MLQIVVPAYEGFDEATNTFIPYREVKLSLEHSLVSLSKWESKWHKPYLTGDKTTEEVIDYVKCMTITQNVPDDVYSRLTPQNINDIIKYIDDPMTATTFREDKNARKNRDIITAEVIYYMMFAAGVPKECEKWHLNRLFTLLRVCGEKNAPPKKMSKREVLSRNKTLNEARRAKLKSKG